MRFVIGTIVLICSIDAATPPAADQEVWTFDRLDKIGGHPATAIGHPHVIDTPGGKAIEFNGVGGGPFIDGHPPPRAPTLTWGGIFFPDGGDARQRPVYLGTESGPGSR